jgi:MFS family permease
VTQISGVLFSLAAVCAALGHRVAGGLMARYSPRLLMTTVAATTAIALLIILLIPSLGTLSLALGIASLGIGVAMTVAYSVAGALLPADAHVTGFGIMTTASLVGLAFSPVLAGIVGASGLRVVFIVDVVLLVALGLAVATRLRAASVSAQPPEAADMSVP